jgi:hypothetical protein
MTSTPTPPASGLSVERLRELRYVVDARYMLTNQECIDLTALLDARLGEATTCSCGLADAEPWLHADWCARYVKPSPVPAAGDAGDATAAEVVEVVAFLTLVRNISNEDEYRQPEQLTMFDRAIALLERLSDNGWQPISTARQGEVVLFCDARGNRWSDCSPDMWHRNGCGYPPTHWRPLPPPPPSPTPTEPGAV